MAAGVRREREMERKMDRQSIFRDLGCGVQWKCIGDAMVADILKYTFAGPQTIYNKSKLWPFSENGVSMQGH